MKYKLSNPCTSFEFKVDSDAEILLGIELETVCVECLIEGHRAEPLTGLLRRAPT